MCETPSNPAKLSEMMRVCVQTTVCLNALLRHFMVLLYFGSSWRRARTPPASVQTKLALKISSENKQVRGDTTRTAKKKKKKHTAASSPSAPLQDSEDLPFVWVLRRRQFYLRGHAIIRDLLCLKYGLLEFLQRTNTQTNTHMNQVYH